MQPSPPIQTGQRRSGPRTLWVVLGALLLCFLCCCGGAGLLGYAGYKKGSVVDNEAKVFAKEAVTSFGAGWKADEFRKYAAPAFLALIASERSNQYFSSWRKKLGNLKQLDEFNTTGIYFGAQNGLPPATRVQLNAPATFEKGSGTIIVGVAKVGDKWGVENFDIHSETLLK